MRLRSFLTRNGYPHQVMDPRTDPDAAEVIRRYAPEPNDFPLVVAPDGTVLKNPSDNEVAQALGMVTAGEREAPYDVAIVGAGPAGLATAVYAASEGLAVAVLDTRAYGGQAGASARIENYLGFPTGISGAALAGRAFVQAQKFGVEVMIPAKVETLDCTRSDGSLGLIIDGGRRVRAKAVVVASGASYRRPAIDNLGDFEGKGVWYWASPIEARFCAGEEVILVGGGNSAGQAAVFLSGHARKVRMMVRARGLAASMSKYLIDRIEASPNIELMTCTEVVHLQGSALGLEKVTWRNRETGEEAAGDIRNLFLFVGADPATGWLDGCGVTLDLAGFVLTGPQDPVETHGADPLETTVAGVFAVGDVRSTSVKRVGSAIGEGAQVVAALHRFLADPVLPIV
jgi:thioredoxin reductase (NADPH)